MMLRADLSRVQRPAQACWRRVPWWWAQRASASLQHCQPVLHLQQAVLMWVPQWVWPLSRTPRRTAPDPASLATLFEADSVKGWMCAGILSAAKGVPSSPSEKCARLQYPARACVS